MRVISGQARGLKLKAPEGLETRPTTDRIKESLFNIISGELYEADFLDLFSGSGGIGIEALSRGARSAVFVDESRKSIEAIKYNLAKSKLAERARVMQSGVIPAVAALGRQGAAFDIIFMDPPYSKGLVTAALKAVQRAGILKENGLIIAEQAAQEADISAEALGIGLEVYRVKDYKRTTKMAFLRSAASSKIDPFGEDKE